MPPKKKAKLDSTEEDESKDYHQVDESLGSEHELPDHDDLNLQVNAGDSKSISKKGHLAKRKRAQTPNNEKEEKSSKELGGEIKNDGAKEFAAFEKRIRRRLIRRSDKVGFTHATNIPSLDTLPKRRGDAFECENGHLVRTNDKDLKPIPPSELGDLAKTAYDIPVTTELRSGNAGDGGWERKYGEGRTLG